MAHQTDRYRGSKLERALRLYLVTDDRWLDGRTLEECVSEAIAGGVTLVQLRDKGAPTELIVEQAKRLLPICRQSGIPLLIDDDVKAASISGADGVHVGQSDAECTIARAALGKDAIIGVSVQIVDQAIKAEANGASYLGVGAMFPTSTKVDADTVSKETLKEICNAVNIPVVAIGGIDRNNVFELAETGIAGVAVISAILEANDIKEAAEGLSIEMGKMLDDQGAAI